MRKMSIIVIFMTIFFIMAGSANATVFTHKKVLHKWLKGHDSKTWTHLLPTEFDSTTHSVNKATVEIFASSVKGKNDKVFVNDTYMGHLKNVKLTGTNIFNLHFRGAKYDVTDMFTPDWSDSSFDVTVKANEFWRFLGVKFKGKLYLKKSIFKLRYKKGVPPAPVPEPATMLLMGTGLAGFMFARRRRLKNQQ